MRLSDEYGGTQVRLHGTVGSPPGLLTSQAFVLLSPDGQGIKVSVPTSKKLPPLGTSISVSGILRFNNLGYPSLQMGAKDSWTVQASSTAGYVPRVVDLISLGAEDAWSFINVTGTVKQIKDPTFVLDLGDAEITVVVRPPVDYRVKRLAVGDVVAVKGILDTSARDPHLLPRSADEITLVSHAQPEAFTAKTTSSALPGWTPLGAAAGAVAVTEGAKQLNRKRRQRQLEKKLVELTAKV
jgi:hypothetical protein